MKYLCLGYFDPVKMEALSKSQLKSIMDECRPYLAELYKTEQVVVDAGLDLATKTMQRVNGKMAVSDGPLAKSNQVIGAAFMLEARDLTEAISLAALHPTTRVAAGEELGWAIEIRPIHHFHAPEVKTPPAPAQVGQIFEAYRQAVLSHNTDALMDLYAPDVRVFDAWGIWVHQDAPAWRKMVHTWFSSITANEQVHVEFNDVQITQGHDLCLVTAIVTYASLTLQGQEIRSMQNRLSWTLSPQSGTWKIIHEHTSAPIGFEDQKAILQRPATP
jgi:uncharacterized protein (TIGR02246 family)